MKRLKTVIFLLCLFCKYSFSTDDLIKDTLVYPHEINYHSDFEKSTFDDFFGKSDQCFIKLLVSKDKNANEEDYYKIKNDLKNFAIQLKNDKNFQKSNKKKVKYLFKTIHDKYLEKYEMSTQFSQIFNNGIYNCVTGSVLYGLLFDELGIQYTIKISPIHAYVVAYPDIDPIIVETTNPAKGYFTFNQSFKENYVKYLKDNKIVSEEEYLSTNANLLFDKYYFKEKDISLKEMIGIQYSNSAIEKIQNQNFEDAFNDLEKAFLFYPSKEIAYLLFYTGVMVVDKQDFSNIKYVDFLYRLARYSNFGVTKEQIIGEFATITQNQLGYKGNYQLYDSIYHKLYNNLNNKEIKNEISFIYNYEKASLYIRNERINDALPFIENALKTRPDHLDLGTMLVYCISAKYNSYNLTEEIINKISAYGINYPALKENKAYNELLCDAYIIFAVQNYEIQNLSTALKFHNKFNEMNVSRQSYTNYEYNVTRLYSAAAVYYFRKGNNKKSKAIIQKGLNLVPNSYELKQRMKAFR